MKINTSKQKFAVKLVHVSKKYEIHHEKPTLVEKVINGNNETFWALQNINIKINKGEKVGLIGLNGSGKTTLLKLIAGITAPTRGTIITNGKTVSLIDLQAGFHPDLTGLQNIYLNGMILGMTKKEVDSKINKICNFADIGGFIDTPIYTYSSGMLLRLGFSVAIHAEPDILVLDENLSVGDLNFHEKSIYALRKFLSSKCTIIIASHDLNFIKQNCNRVIWIDKGKVVSGGPAKQVIDKYTLIGQ